MSHDSEKGLARGSPSPRPSAALGSAWGTGLLVGGGVGLEVGPGHDFRPAPWPMLLEGRTVLSTGSPSRRLSPFHRRED